MEVVYNPAWGMYVWAFLTGFDLITRTTLPGHEEGRGVGVGGRHPAWGWGDDA